MSESVLYSKDERGVASVSLNRPNKHNAFDDAIIAKLTDLFKRINADESIRAMLLRAEGKTFSAGGDLNWMRRMADYSQEENQTDAQALAAMLHALNYLNKPTIAVVQGAAFGGAVGLVSCCDMAVASTQARFCLSEVKIGLLPATISPYVVAAIGQRAARRYFLTAEVFDAQQAQAMGLVSKVVEENELQSATESLLTSILANGPQAVSAAKQLIFDVALSDIDDALIEDTSQRIAKIRVSEEGQEGLNAFLQKRKPNWQSSS